MSFNVDDDAWQYGSPNFNNWGATTAGEIDTLFANGNYTVSVPTFLPVTLNLTTPGVALNTPQFSLTGGTWSSGGSRSLRIDAQGKALGMALLEMPIHFP
jgi:hypothetical protein